MRSWLGSTSDLSEDERAFLQLRVGRFGFWAGWLFMGFLGFRVIGAAFAPKEYWPMIWPSLVFHGLSSSSFVTIWLLTRSGQRSARYVRAVESGGLAFGAAFLLAMGFHIPLFGRPDFILLLALGTSLFIRSIYVPSSPKRTLVLGVAVGVELLIAVYLMSVRVNLDNWVAHDPGYGDITPVEFALAATFGNALPWWVVIVVITTMATKVIYGLRRDVRKAQQMGQYDLVAKLGEGGMGMVFRARHMLLRRPAAVKLLLPEKAGAHSIKRFEREVRLTAKLRDPHVVTVFDYGRTPEAVFYYAMELVEGATLMDVVKSTGPMEPDRAAAVLSQVCSALVEAHGVGLIHRDIKPANIMLELPHRYGGVSEMAKVLDFGLVKQTADTDARITLHGALAGTPQYMAPEVIREADDIDGRSDLYALGCVAFFMLTGEHLFEGSSIMDVCAKHLQDEPDTPAARLGKPIPADLERAVMACLEKDPANRPQTAAQLKLDLEACACHGGFTAFDAHEWWEEYGVLFESGEALEAGHLTVDIARASSSTPDV